MDALRVFLNVAGHGDFGVEAENVALVFLRPESEAGDNGRSAMMREFREGRSGAGLPSEEIDKHPLVECRVLIDQDADSVAGL